jgi:hypothetical protein
VVVLIVTTISRCTDARSPSGDESIALAPMDTLVTTASELIGGVYDVAVSPHGDVYVVDYGFKRVLVVGPDGTVRRTIGREGSGPGEFEMPYIVRADADSVRVLDAASNRVQVFDSAGVVVRTYRVDAPGLGGGRDFGSDGSLVATIEGLDHAMLLVLDAAGDRIGSFGKPIVPPVTFYDFAAIKAAIRDGRVPDAFRNRAAAAWGPDRSLYLAFHAEPQVRRYDAAGGLLWTRTLDEPVLDASRAAFVRKNIEEQDPSRIHTLQYVTDAAVVGDDLWLLLNTADEDDGLLLVLRANDGSVRRRVTFPGLPNTGYFTVDQSRRKLYMAPRGDASVLVFPLPSL